MTAGAVSTQPLGSLIDRGHKPREPANNDDVWNLNLDQIEPHTGRVLSKCILNASELGPSTYAFDRGTVLYSKLRPYLNKVVVADDDGVATTELVPLRCDESRLNAQYLAHFLRGPDFLQFATNLVAGAKMPRMVMSEFWKFPVPLPPLPEQRRIAAILDQADSLRAKRREALAQLDSLTQSIFIEMFGESLLSFKRTPLGDLVEEFRYGTSEKSGDSGFPALRIPNVANGHLNLSELKTVPVEAAEFRRLQLKSGDLLFVRTNGNPENVGRCAVFEPSLVEGSGFKPSEFIYASYLIRGRLKARIVLPVVLQQYLHVGEGRQALRAVCKTSAGQYNINTEGLGAIAIPIFPIASQEAFATRIQAVASLKTTHRAALAELDALFASLQHRAFSGQLS